MTWDEIMKIEDPREAMKAIDKKAKEEKTAIAEIEKIIEKYTTIHQVTEDEMCFYPNGERVLKYW